MLVLEAWGNRGSSLWTTKRTKTFRDRADPSSRASRTSFKASSCIAGWRGNAKKGTKDERQLKFLHSLFPYKEVISYKHPTAHTQTQRQEKEASKKGGKRGKEHFQTVTGERGFLTFYCIRWQGNCCLCMSLSLVFKAYSLHPTAIPAEKAERLRKSKAGSLEGERATSVHRIKSGAVAYSAR